MGAAVLLACAGSAAAEDAASPKGTVYVWGGQGPGKVDSRKVSTTDPGGTSSWVKVEATGCLASGYAYALAGTTDSDVGMSARADSSTSYQLTVTDCGDWVATWAANGSMDWRGSAEASTTADADVAASAVAHLGYSGDLKLAGAGAVAVNTTGASNAEVTWQISLKPSYSVKYTRTAQTSSDACSGSAHADSQGTGSTVRVDVRAYAQVDVSVDVNAFGFGLGSAKLDLINSGMIHLSVTLTEGGSPPTGGGGGGGPSTGGGGGGGPTTGGPDGTGVTTPRTKIIRVAIEAGEPPRSPDGNVPVSRDYPDPPKPVASPEPTAVAEPSGK